MNKKLRIQEGGPRRKLRNQAGGQVVLMVLLASVLVLTLGLSAARQATVETSIDTDQELLKRAFNAAESGIDYYLKTGEKKFGNVDSAEGSSVLTTENLGNDKTLSFNRIVGPESGEFFWLVDHIESGDIGTSFFSGLDSTIDICVDGTLKTQLKIDYFYKEGNYKVVRGDGVNPILTTNGLTPNCINNYNLKYTAGANSILMVVTPIKDDVKISVKGEVSFPVQGIKIKSTGMVGKVNNLVTIDRPYRLIIPFLLEPVVSESVVTN